MDVNVFLCLYISYDDTSRDKASGQAFAIKTIRKEKVHRVESLTREIMILKTLDHPNIIKVSSGGAIHPSMVVHHHDMSMS